MNAVGEAAKRVLSWAARTGNNVVIHSARVIDSALSQVVYSIKGAGEIVVNQYDAESKDEVEITLTEDVIKKLAKLNPWKD